jgi:hypothetical protein
MFGIETCVKELVYNVVLHLYELKVRIKESDDFVWGRGWAGWARLGYSLLKNQREKCGSCTACASPFSRVTKISNSTITLKRKLILYY